MQAQKTDEQIKQPQTQQPKEQPKQKQPQTTGKKEESKEFKAYSFIDSVDENARQIIDSLEEGGTRVEIKLLDESDLKLVFKFLIERGSTVKKQQLRKLLSYKETYGAFVERRLVGVLVGEIIGYDGEEIYDEGDNALFIYEPIIDDFYEGKGLVVQLLTHSMKKAVQNRGVEYIVCQLDDVLPPTNLEDVLKERGSKFGQILLKFGFEFIPYDDYTLAVKQI